MRVIRRRFAMMRFGEAGTPSDLDVRQLSNSPSVDCLLQRKRLLYLRRILLHAPRPLVAALHIHIGDRCLPWTSMIVDDMATLSRYCSLDLPHPAEQHMTWLNYIVESDEHEWKKSVSHIHYIDSCCDRTAIKPSNGTSPVQLYSCTLCSPSRCFSSEKALASHRRATHSIKTEVRAYVDGSICPVCKVDFRQRVRVLQHLGDTRRPCRQRLFDGNYPRISEEAMLRLDEVDRHYRRQCQQEGYTGIIARDSAMKGGKPVGRCTR